MTLLKEFKEIADRYLKVDDYQTHLNYILYSLDDDQLSGLSQSDRMYKVRFLIIYFFSSLFYGRPAVPQIRKETEVAGCLPGRRIPLPAGATR